MNKRMFGKIFLSFLLIVTLFVTTAITPLTLAQTSIPEEYNSLAETFKDFNKNYSEMPEEKTNDLKKELLTLIKQGTIKLQSNGELDFKDIQSKQNGENNVLYMPIEYKNIASMLNISALTVIFDNKGELVNYDERKIVADDKNYTSQIEIYTDGVLTKSENVQLTKEDFMITPEKEKNSDSILSFLKPDTAEAASWASKFFNCLDDQGVPSWVYKTLTVVCGIACATAVLCVPCAVGAALVFEADIMYCVGKANGNY
ncbi:hypothetical protein [Lysinibacillus sp. Bpr_S20]|uniref:hypothetical protein n=1 Tax=Lysinibacillus sp. Bpr_S20 TaxID=2933964 RepID=UPI0020125FA9|nr:hypothetical protein [Lysinibacillus sp. Bpr_S20]MCL1701705.1 hypothetical protein [Lysinibacillus sp. Bpr_S20]